MLNIISNSLLSHAVPKPKACVLSQSPFSSHHGILSTNQKSLVIYKESVTLKKSNWSMVHNN